MRPRSAARARAVTSPLRPSRQLSICRRNAPSSAADSSGRGARESTPRADSAISRQALRRLASVRSKTPSRKPVGARSLMAAIATVAGGERVAAGAPPSTPKRGAPVMSASARAAHSAAPRPGPRRRAPRPSRPAASPCSQTAAEAAANGSIPCARRPSTIPASTSPLPAVARSGGAFCIDRGAAVRRGDHRVGALQHDDRSALPRRRDAPARACCRRDRRAARTRPRCGVSTQGARIAANKASGSPVNEVSASASSTADFRRAEDRQRRVAGLAANPGARADQRRVAPLVGEQLRKARRDRQPGARSPRSMPRHRPETPRPARQR